MPKILFIALHRPDRSPSQRFRYEQYIDFLTEHGWTCEASHLIPEKWDASFYEAGNYLVKLKVLVYSIFKRIKDTLRSNQFDVIFIQREALMIGSTYFERKFSQSKAKIVFDFDDAIWLPNVSDGNRKLEWMKVPSKTAAIIALADLVFAGNEYLSVYAKQHNKQVKVVPTTIDTDRHYRNGVSNDSGTVCIGWTGSVTTIRHFERALPVLKALKKKYGNGVSFKVIGDENYQNELLEVKGIRWSSETEIEDLLAFDIGIMPLPDDEWAKGKCALKGLQYMALEIPCVMSPVGMNTTLIKDGENGFLAAGEAEWFQKLCMLIEDKALRDRVGGEARQTILSHYSVHSQKTNYLNYLNALLSH